MSSLCHKRDGIYGSALPLSCGQMKTQILSGILKSYLQFAKLLKLPNFWISDNLLSTLLWYGRIFRFWATASLSFGTLTNSHLFGMSSSLSAILFTTRDFRDSSYQYILAPQPYGWTCVCWDKIVTIDLTENIKSFLIYTLILNIWASFPDLEKNTLAFCYCWWVVINKVTFTSIINIRLRCSKRCSKRYVGFKALTMNLMPSMDDLDRR